MGRVGVWGRLPRRALGRVVAATVLGTGGALTGAASLWAQTQAGAFGATGGSAAVMTAQQLAQQAQNYNGATVNVVGHLAGVVGINAFALGDRGIFGNDVLVLTQQPLQSLLDQQSGGQSAAFNDDIVGVIGTVHVLTTNQLQQMLGTSIPGGRLSVWAGRPVIFAQRVDFSATIADLAAAEARLAGQPTDQLGQTGGQTGQSGQMGQAPGQVVNMKAIANNFDQYRGQQITAIGDVDGTLSSHAIVVNSVLVVTPFQLPTLSNTQPGSQVRPIEYQDLVQVTGIAAPFDLNQFQQQLGVDLSNALGPSPFPGSTLASNWQGQPAIMARSLRRLNSVAVGPAAG